jgi:hypothetical protein
MSRAIGLVSSTLLLVLAIQAEPVTATLGFIWAFIHIAAVIKNWYATND